MKAVTPLDPPAPSRSLARHVLVLCSVCGRFIAHEDGHGCALGKQERQERRIARRLKNLEIGRYEFDDY